MPKSYDQTRKFKAEELLQKIENGPCFDHDFDRPLGDSKQGEIAAKIASENYRLWAKTWIVPQIKELVPELRKKQK